MYNKYTTAAKQWRLCSHQSFVSCLNAKLGCAENVSLGKESLHKKECNFSPCSCPVQDCNFPGSYIDLYDVKKILEVNLETPQENSMLIPHSLLRGELLDLKLCIKKLNQE
ncbi:hypothetical protein YC2023_045948 [Brassica napus]